MSREVRTRLAKEILALKWPDPLVDATRGWNNALDVLVEVKLTDDIEKVVLCKDCKHYKTMFCKMDIWHKDITLYRAKENDYCSYGERKDG